MAILRYSKSSGFYKELRREFFGDNDGLLENSLSQNSEYISQPKRSSCKLCHKNIPSDVDFTSHNVSYVFCKNCGHLNGVFEDSINFVKKIYIDDAGENYSKNYIDKSFSERTNNIYIPKVDFLIESLPSKNDIQILDIGCGSGYFVYAGLLKNVNVTGIDVSKSMISYGNSQIEGLINKRPLTLVEESEFSERIETSSAEVISAIGVIEHLREPYKLFESFQKSSVNYLFYSVPMFSFSVILENILTEVFPRQLSGGHTHLFTESSIAKMNEILDCQSVAEWRFGTDAMDLLRATSVMLRKNGGSKKLDELFQNNFGGLVDDIQSLFDKKHFCSEIHCLIKKN